MREIIFFILIITCTILNAQTFELVGPRAYNPNNWDVPTSVNLYFDSSGTLYNYISEANQPRSNELVSYNETSDTWTNLTNNNFSVPGGSGNTGGVPMADGSIVTITSSFGANFQHYAYTVFPDGTSTPFPSHPLPTGNNAGIHIFPVQAPNGDIYYSHSVIDVDVGRWDGTQWTELPEVTTGTFGGSSGIGVDENGDVYAVHTDNTTNNNARFVKFDANTNSWNQLFLSTETGLRESEIYVVSSTEIYIYYANLTQMFVTRFDGNNFSSMGSPVPGDDTFLRPGAMLKSQATGDVYLAGNRPDGNGFYKYNAGTNNWDVVINDIADGGIIVGYQPTLAEKDGCIYVSSNENNAITTVKYCPNCVPATITFGSIPSVVSSNQPVNLSATPSGGIFSGNGVIFSAFNPSLAGSGFSTITYTYQNAEGCESTASVDIFVFNISYNFVNYNLGTVSPKIINEIEINIEVPKEDTYSFEVFDVQGRSFYKNKLILNEGLHQQQISLKNSINDGMFFIKIANNEAAIIEKFVR